MGPTPQTVANLRPNPLADFPKELQTAAEELRDLWLVVTGPTQVASQKFERSYCGAWGSIQRPGLLTDWEWICLGRYREWSDEMNRRHLPSRPVVRVVTDDKLFEEVLIPQLGIVHPDQVKALVSRGLQIFVDLVGSSVLWCK